MELETFEEIVRILALAGYAMRFLGLLVLGLGAGWLASAAYKKSDSAWRTQAVIIFVFAAITAMIVRFQTSGAVGAYALGAGAALLLWGLRQDEFEYVEEEDDD